MREPMEFWEHDLPRGPRGIADLVKYELWVTGTDGRRRTLELYKVVNPGDNRHEMRCAAKTTLKGWARSVTHPSDWED